MAHTFSHLAVHIVFGTKDRTPIIVPTIKTELHAYLGGIIREEGCKAISINGTEDHVHILVTLGPTKAMSDLMRVVKSNSSRWVHEKWPERAGFGWQQGYGAFSVSRSAMQDVEGYIARQEEHHRKISFEQEFIMLLKKHDIAYDENYLWK
jgi:REP element-mobilizing transposase RayT